MKRHDVFRLLLWGGASFYAHGQAVDLDLKTAGASFLGACKKKFAFGQPPRRFNRLFSAQVVPSEEYRVSEKSPKKSRETG